MAVPPGRALSSGEPGGRLCADLRQDHADVRSWQICGQGNGTETSVCAADEISDGSGGKPREVRREAACGGRRVQERYIPQVGAGRRVSGYG